MNITIISCVMKSGKKRSGIRSILNSVRETNALLASKTPPVRVKAAKQVNVTYTKWKKLHLFTYSTQVNGYSRI